MILVAGLMFQAPAERLASLERSSYLNDAYRALRNPVSRIEHLLAIEGLPSAKSEEGTARVPPALLEEVFALNEELDEIREQRESGAGEEPRGPLQPKGAPVRKAPSDGEHRIDVVV